MDIVVPNILEKPPKIRYRIPISLWLVEKNHLEKKEYSELV